MDTDGRENRSGTTPARVPPTHEASGEPFGQVVGLGSAGGGGSACALGPGRVRDRATPRAHGRCHKGVSGIRYIWAIGLKSYNVTRADSASVHAPGSPRLWGERGGDRYELQRPRNRPWGRNWG